MTVIHDSAPELARLLASVQRHLPGARVVVADSGSSDKGADVARAWSGGATVVELDGNIGFGRACNAALASVDEPVAVLVNPDVELLDGSLAALAAECAHPEAAPRLLAPVVLRPDGSRQDNAHPDPLSLAAGIAALIPPAALPRRLGVALAPWRSSEARRVAWAVGCCLAARTETLRRLGPFDERIFLYAEDLDLGLRAGEAGVETWLWPHARVLHHGAHTSARVFGGEPIELLARARAEVIARRRGAAGARLDAWVQRATFTDRIVLKSLAGRSTAREQRQRAALRGLVPPARGVRSR